MANFNTDMSVAIPLTTSSRDRKRIAQQILRVLELSPHNRAFKTAKVLDVGSSSGEVASYLAPKFKKIICIDTDKNAILLGKKKFASIKNVAFAVFDGSHINYHEANFDYVILRRVVECVEKPEALIREIYRVLKPGGLVYFESQNIIWPDFNWDPAAFVPVRIKLLIANLMQKKQFYFAIYRNYWQLKNLFRKFEIQVLTPHIISHPERYNFRPNRGLRKLAQVTPLPVLFAMEPVTRLFFWVLKKN